ncbi:MAG: pentapeptide repeat-containing protein [Cyanobacteriota bacterium]|nr:pentapeptide repeat-containing protein [Cyanobacteriota bacterium]
MNPVSAESLSPDLDGFLALSAELTGFDRGTLSGTGMVGVYFQCLREQLGEEGVRSLLDTAGITDAHACQRLIRLWYTGLWGERQVHPDAYREGLFWRAIGASPPGSRPPGYGTWALEPPLGAELAKGLVSLLLVLTMLFGGWVDVAQAADSGDLQRLEQSNSCNRCDLSAADLARKDLYSATINGANLTGADLSGSLMSDSRLAQATLDNANLQGVYLTGADLSNATLNHANLRKGKLTNAILRGTSLNEADLEGADLSSADLRQSQLTGAHLVEANLTGAQLQNADLSGADLTRADLRHSNLKGADLEGALLCGADLLEALMPDGLRSVGDSTLTNAC